MTAVCNMSVTAEEREAIKQNPLNPNMESWKPSNQLECHENQQPSRKLRTKCHILITTITIVYHLDQIEWAK